MQERPIGIFDSGIGGLTVFREIAKRLPQEDLIYLGDTARVPYGTKSAETVTRYAVQNIRLLIQRGVKMVVIACNTASSFALTEVTQQFEIPILGVIEPGVRGALNLSKTKRIGVIGTEGTIESRAYTRLLQRLEPRSIVYETACPLFVPLVEEGRWEGKVVETIAQGYLEKLLTQKIDVLILGCTHYPLLKETLKKIVRNEITLIDSAEETARETVRLLTQKNRIRSGNKTPQRKFLVTDSPGRFQRLGHLFLKEPLCEVEHVEI